MNFYTKVGAVLILVGGGLIQWTTGYELFSAQYLKLWGSMIVCLLGMVIFFGSFD